LDRHWPRELVVSGEIDPAERAFTETSEHAIAANRRGNRPGGGGVGGISRRSSQQCGDLRVGNQICSTPFPDVPPQLVRELGAIATELLNGGKKALALDFLPLAQQFLDASVGFHCDSQL